MGFRLSNVCAPLRGEKTLRAKCNKSEWFCKCGKTIHTKKCPLVPMFYHERRWPGGDAYITAEENMFLSQLNLRPKWWDHALCTPKRYKYHQ